MRNHGKKCRFPIRDWLDGSAKVVSAEAMEKKKIETSKKVIFVILLLASIWVSLSYVLAYLGKEQTLEDLSKLIVSAVIVAILGYFLKSYFGKYHEEKNNLMRESLEIENELENKMEENDL